MSTSIRVLRTDTLDFETSFRTLIEWDTSEDSDVNRAARAIVDDVKRRGDAALLEYTQRFDHLTRRSVAELEIDSRELARCLDGLARADREALESAAKRIERFHEHQRQQSFEIADEHGNRLGSRVTPLERVGVYVPGGQAAYPSTVLMTMIPARVAGVREIVMTVPTPNGERHPWVLAAASLARVDRVYAIGGAQAIAALAFGTATVPRVDKIVGPGGAYVAAAKRLVFGPVGIDLIAGPSEIVVVADGTTPVDWVVLDLFSQAEHDEAARAIMLTPNDRYLDAIRLRIDELLPTMARRATIAASLRSRGALIRTRDLTEAIEIANRIAPEHVELAVADPDALLPSVHHAGAVFLGAHTAEVLGDYVAGPSHVLPTFGTARFASPLGVYDFQKRTSIIRCTPAGAAELARIATPLALGEGLDAHARAAQVRVEGFDHNRPRRG
jgi:histidinol dehydrogenase